MSGIFSKPKAPAYVPPPAPSAPVEEATFTPGAEEDKDTAVKKRKIGKKRLQIPSGSTTTATTSTGLGGL